jgi:hypothetical protein
MNHRAGTYLLQQPAPDLPTIHRPTWYIIGPEPRGVFHPVWKHKLGSACLAQVTSRRHESNLETGTTRPIGYHFQSRVMPGLVGER